MFGDAYFGPRFFGDRFFGVNAMGGGDDQQYGTAITGRTPRLGRRRKSARAR